MYGTVYRARSLKTDKIVAIKCVKLVNDNEPYMRTVCRELKVLQILSQLPENIATVKCLDMYFPPTTDITKWKSLSRLYIVMDYFPTSLEQVIYDTTSKFSSKQALSIAY